MTSLLKDEKILAQLYGEKLTLTTHRVRYQERPVGKANIKSIMLEELTGCEFTLHSKKELILYAIIIPFIGIFLSFIFSNTSISFIGLSVMLSVIILIAYLCSRKKELRLCSAGSTIVLPILGYNTQDVLNIIDQIEVSKNDRYLLKT